MSSPRFWLWIKRQGTMGLTCRWSATRVRAGGIQKFWQPELDIQKFWQPAGGIRAACIAIGNSRSLQLQGVCRGNGRNLQGVCAGGTGAICRVCVQGAWAQPGRWCGGGMDAASGGVGATCRVCVQGERAQSAGCVQRAWARVHQALGGFGRFLEKLYTGKKDYTLL